MRYEIDSEEILTIYDKKVSMILRKLTGNGRILIPSEIENKQILIKEIKKHFD